MADENFEGHQPRECGEHRTTGGRAWCFGCSEWCYPEQPCKGCELPMLRDRLERAERVEAENEELHVQVVGKAIHAEQMEAAANSARAALEDSRPDIALSLLRAALEGRD